MNYIKRALIVDSNPSSATLLSMRLNGFGFQTDQVSSSQSVISYLEDQKKIPDIIIVDIASNDSKLIELPQEIKSSLPWADKIPIVAFTAVSHRQFVINAIENGYADYIIRPLTSDAFISRIRNAIDKTYSLNGENYFKSISEKATLSGDLLLIEINEFGVRALSKIKFAENQSFHLISTLMDSFEMNSIYVSVHSCVPHGNGQFLLTLRFIGILPTQATLIRKFLMRLDPEAPGNRREAS